MKTETRTVYIARDGREFLTERECRAYERENSGAALVGLTEAQIEAARAGEDPDLAEAFEAFGYELRKARQAAGQFKRKRANGGANNDGEKSEPPLRDNAGPRSADSADRTNTERGAA